MSYLHSTLRAAFILSLALAGIATVVAVVAHFLSNPADVLKNRQLIAEVWREFLLPEPEERAAYIATVLAAFPLALWIVSAARRKETNPVPATTAIAWSIAAAFLLSCGFFELSFVRTIFAATGNAGLPLWLQASGAMVAVIAFLRWYFRTDTNIRHLSARSETIVNIALAILVIGAVGGLRIRSADMLYGDVHFEATFYSISQVVSGKTVLADLPAQYGLYAEILGPLLRVTGVTILGFTTFLSLLFVISIISLCAFCSATLRSIPLRIIAVLTTFLYVGTAWRMLGASINGIEEYYQLWPIRILFPALVVALFVTIRRRNLGLIAVASLAIVLGIAMIWNLDWGVPSFGALVAFFLVRLIFSPASERLANGLRLATTVVIPLVILALFAGYLTLKSGGHINWADWLKYQTIFYSSGFGMLPLPLFPHPWMVVIAIYLYGLTHGIAMQARQRADFQSDTILVLSVLGIGIFTYYQGRSHDVVLTMVMWPAILIAFMIADQTLRAVKLGRLPSLVGWGTAPILVFGMMSVITLLYGLPNLLNIATTTISSVAADPASARGINAAFIRSKTRGDRSAAILDPGQSVLFIESGLTSAVRGPGIIEMLLVKDREQIVADLIKDKVAHVFIRADADGQLPIEYRPLLQDYKIDSHSEAGLLYLVPS
ncbi:MAG TPA: hypothetical protein VL133_01550 [Devosia sp.]|nr:hypothetical protein [Devosia sp.]